MNKLEILRKSELFCDLTDEQIRLIEKLSTFREFEPGTVMCQQNYCLDELYVIEKGVAGLMLEVGLMTQRQVQAAGQFSVLGWSALLEPTICSASVKALEKTRVLAINGQKLRELLTSRPDIGAPVYKRIACMLAARLDSAFTQLLGVTSQV